LEGPYISPAKAYGAHNPQLARKPDWTEFMNLQDAAGGNIAIVTLAPELPNAIEFIHRAQTAGVLVAIGHTDAGPNEIHRAIEAGAQLSTHFGNGCPTFIHRHFNPLWAQLASEQLQTSLICDGFHLPPDLVRVVVKAKGIHKCILISDAVHVAELAPGRYKTLATEVELLASGQVIAVGQDLMVGSSLSMNRAVPLFARFARVPIAKALRAASTNPATILRRRRRSLCTSISTGEVASVVTFYPSTDKLRIDATFVDGRCVYAQDTTGADMR